MLTTGSSAPIRISPSTSRLRVLSNRGRSGMEQPSWRFVLAAALGVGACILPRERTHVYWLVPDLGRNHERLLVEALSALTVGCLIAKLVGTAQERHRLTVARMQAIADESSYTERDDLNVAHSTGDRQSAVHPRDLRRCKPH